jgi:hypothetical protein
MAKTSKPKFGALGWMDLKVKPATKVVTFPLALKFLAAIVWLHHRQITIEPLSL